MFTGGMTHPVLRAETILPVKFYVIVTDIYVTYWCQE